MILVPTGQVLDGRGVEARGTSCALTPPLQQGVHIHTSMLQDLVDELQTKLQLVTQGQPLIERLV